MGSPRSFHALIFWTFIVCTTARIARQQEQQNHQQPQERLAHQRHDAVHLNKRQADSSTSAVTSSAGVLGYITPSPGALPVAITQQSQIVTSYVPQFTLCDLPPQALVPTTSTAIPVKIKRAPFTNSSSSVMNGPAQISTTSSSAPYGDYTVSYGSGTGSCITVYTPTDTMVCTTTLSALATKYTVSKCDQELTFSTKFGYTLITPGASSSPALPPVTSLISADSSSSPPSPVRTSLTLPTSAWSAGKFSSFANVTYSSSGNSSAVPPMALLAKRYKDGMRAAKEVELQARATITAVPSIETLTTYYLAPWQELTAGTAPGHVELKICRQIDSDTDECTKEYQVWSTTLVTKTTTTVTSLNISTTIHGPSQFLVETYVANITEQLTTFSMSTTLNNVYEIEVTKTMSGTRSDSGAVVETYTGPTITSTVTVMPVPQNTDTTTTSTLHITSTIVAGTSTITVPSSASVTT